MIFKQSSGLVLASETTILSTIRGKKDRRNSQSDVLVMVSKTSRYRRRGREAVVDDESEAWEKVIGSARNEGKHLPGVACCCFLRLQPHNRW